MFVGTYWFAPEEVTVTGGIADITQIDVTTTSLPIAYSETQALAAITDLSQQVSAAQATGTIDVTTHSHEIKVNYDG